MSKRQLPPQSLNPTVIPGGASGEAARTRAPVTCEAAAQREMGSRFARANGTW